MAKELRAWAEYLRRVTQGDTQAQIASRTGLAESNVGRWLREQGGRPKPDSVIAVATAYGQPPMEALIAAGYATPNDLTAPARTPLSAYSLAELLDEVRRRTVGGDGQ